MLVRSKEKFLKYIFIYRNIHFIKYETNIEDKELNKVIEILNIKNRYKRIYSTIISIADYIDNYYKDCDTCNFKNNKCICHRKLNRDYINGCCRICIYQSNTGCTTKNVACKLYLCSNVKLSKEKLEFKNIYLTKLLSPYQRYVLRNDYFTKIENVSTDLYVGPICLIIKTIIRYIYFFIKRRQNENICNRKQ